MYGISNDILNPIEESEEEMLARWEREAERADKAYAEGDGFHEELADELTPEQELEYLFENYK